MKVVWNDDIDIASWNAFAEANRYGSPFQQRGFYELCNSVTGLSADAAAVIDDGVIRGLAVVTRQSEPGLKGFFSRRSIIYGGPLFEEGCVSALEQILDAVNRTAGRETIYTETRNLFNYSDYKSHFSAKGYIYKPYVNFHVDTTDISSILNRMSSSRRRQILKGRNEGVEWKVAGCRDEVIRFYDILGDLYRKKIKKPLPPVEFFTGFFESGPGKYLMVWYQGRIIGGIMCPVQEGKAIYEFYVCGLDEDYKNQHPSVMATWAAIEYAAQNGIPRFDFMGAGPPDRNYGVRDFKARFGGEKVEYGRFIRINKPLLYETGKLGLKLSGGLGI